LSPDPESKDFKELRSLSNESVDAIQSRVYDENAILSEKLILEEQEELVQEARRGVPAGNELAETATIFTTDSVENQ
jgi:hypothetical protein